MDDLCRQVQALTTAVTRLNTTVAAQQAQIDQLSEAVRARRPDPPAQLVEPKMPLPEKFTGARSDFRNFKHRCLSYFEVRPVSSGSEAQRVILIKTLLQGDSQTWAYGLPPGHEALTSVDAFFDAMSVIYDDPDMAATALRKLRALRQGRNSAEEYASEFRRWSVSSNWDQNALLDQFLLGLSDAVNDALISHPEPRTLEEGMSLAIRVDRRIRHRQSGKSRPSFRPEVPSRSASPSTHEEPMQIGQTKLSPAERQRRRQEGLCLYCGEKGHMLAKCSRRAENSSA